MQRIKSGDYLDINPPKNNSPKKKKTIQFKKRGLSLGQGPLYDLQTLDNKINQTWDNRVISNKKKRDLGNQSYSSNPSDNSFSGMFQRLKRRIGSISVSK